MPSYTFDLHSRMRLPQDNGYLILSGLSRQHPFLHGREDIQIAPVRGTRLRKRPGMIRLDQNSKLHIRGISKEEADRISMSWFVARHNAIGIGEYREVPLRGVSRLASRLVIFADVVDREDFERVLMEHVQRVAPEDVEDKPQVLVGRRRAFHMKGRKLLGYSVVLEGLSPEHSINIQRHGLGKFTSMGCGVFYPGTM